MATWAILQHLQRHGLGPGPGPGRRGGMHGYVVLGEDAWFGLGALTADQAVEQVIPSSVTGWAAQMRAATVLDVQKGQLVRGGTGGPLYVPGTPDCAAAAGTGQSGNVKLAQVGSSLALTGINVAAALSTTVATALGTALGPATLGISALIGLFPLLFGHHGAAVKKEQSILCAAVPAANNYLQIIDDGVRTGKVSPQQGIDALNSLLSDFQSAVSPIMSGTSPADGKSCNAACTVYAALKAIVIYNQSQYQDLAAQTTPAMTSGSGPTSAAPVSSGSTLTIPASSPSGAPVSTGVSWLPIAALIAVGFIASRFL